MKINFVKKILKKIKNIKEYLIMFFTVIVFLSFIIYVFINNKPKHEDIPNYENLVKNNFNEYNKKINRTNNNLKEILENSQLNEIINYDNLINENFNIQNNKNPFIKSF